MKLDIKIADPAWRVVPDLRKLARAAIHQSLDDGNVSVSVLFTSDEAMRELNMRWRGKNKATNVLSFPASGPQVPGELRALGDIALGFGVVAAEAGAQRKAIRDHAAHLLVHGCLHLLGYDHERQQDARAMERREISILGKMGIDDPYAS